MALGMLVSAPAVNARPGRSEPTATQKETARALMDTGRARERAGDQVGALEAYIAADKIMGVPSTGLSVARAYTALGKLVEARDALLRVARFPVEEGEPKPYAAAREEAARIEATITPRIPSLRIVVQNDPAPPKLAAAIDGAQVPAEALAFPVKVNPGARTVVVSAKGFLQVERTLEVKEREHAELRLRLEIDPNAPKEPEPRPGGAPIAEQPTEEGVSPVAWVGLGIGGACLLVGIITGALAISKSSELDDVCPDKGCPPERESDIDSMTALAHTSTVTLVLAGVGAVVGIAAVAAFYSSDEEDGTEDAALSLGVGPGSLSLWGRF